MSPFKARPILLALITLLATTYGCHGAAKAASAATVQTAFAAGQSQRFQCQFLDEMGRTVVMELKVNPAQSGGTMSVHTQGSPATHPFNDDPATRVGNGGLFVATRGPASAGDNPLACWYTLYVPLDVLGASGSTDFEPHVSFSTNYTDETHTTVAGCHADWI